MFPPLALLLQTDRVAVGLRAESKTEAMDAALRLLGPQPGVADPARLGLDVAAREAQFSTGVGDGLALPHARTTAVTQTVAVLCTLAAPVEWDADDGAPVDLVLMFAGPDSARHAHVHFLAHVSAVLSDAAVRRRLAEAGSPRELLDAIEWGEQKARR